MAEPKIIFCSNNHIYDAALYSSCPYCAKIAREQEELNDTVSGRIVADEASFIHIVDDDHTELIRSKSNNHAESKKFEDDDRTELIRVEEEDRTELIRGDRTIVESDVQSDEYTELLFREDRHSVISSLDNEKENSAESGIEGQQSNPCGHTGSSSNETGLSVEIKEEEDTGNIVGWFVIKSGHGCGHSIELCENTKGLYLNKECLMSSCLEDRSDNALINIMWDDMIYIYSQSKAVFKVNGIEKNKLVMLRSYDQVSISGFELVYVELMPQLLRWDE